MGQPKTNYILVEEATTKDARRLIKLNRMLLKRIDMLLDHPHNTVLEEHLEQTINSIATILNKYPDA